eukprot:jgi/Pico_ML_1/55443/g1126.t1
MVRVIRVPSNIGFPSAPPLRFSIVALAAATFPSMRRPSTFHNLSRIPSPRVGSATADFWSSSEMQGDFENPGRATGDAVSAVFVRADEDPVSIPYDSSAGMASNPSTPSVRLATALSDPPPRRSSFSCPPFSPSRLSFRFG